MNPNLTLASPMILALMFGLFSLPAIAAPLDCGPWGYEYRAERMGQFHQKLHDDLKLNPDQELAWKKMVASERPMAWSKPANAEEWAKLTTPERGAKRLQHLKAEQGLMADHVAALNDFYAVLMPEQKAVFDEFHSRMNHGMRGRTGSRLPKAGKPVTTP